MRLLVTLALLSVAGGIRVPVWPTKTDKDTQKSAETDFATYSPHAIVNYKNTHLGSASHPLSRTKQVLKNNVKKHFNGTPYFKPKNLDSYRIPQPTQSTNILTKNYRDDTTHETKDFHRESIGSNEDLRQKLLQNGVDKSEHSLPKDIPTKPVYPGLGNWAKQGEKHYPYTRDHKFTTLQESNPEGIEIFKENEENVFNKQFAKFQSDFSSETPIEDQNNEQSQSIQEHNQEEEEKDRAQEDDEEFIPTKTYSQVREHEIEEHLPSDPNEPRLREVVIDKTTRVVYTEEGYEDSAYDHAGHEKKAENSEGDVDYEKGNQKSPSDRIRSRKNRIKAEELDASRIVEEQLDKEDDSETAGSNHELIKKTKVPHPTRKFSKTQEVKMAEMKKTPNGKVEMEISTEIKVLSSPNNKTTAHKYVKIIPKHPQKIRRKRYVLDLPNIEIDTDFIGKLNKNPEPPREHEDLNRKYPYYNKNDANINEHSPLKYAEDLSNVPEKIEGQMSFYQHADKKVCPEVETDIDPIPEHVKNKSENGEQEKEGEENDEKNVKQPELPRLKNLGDKIDCFKAKYFGENPLDSPFFSEDVVSPPKPIFQHNTPEVTKGKQIRPTYIKEVNKLRRPQRNSQEISNDSPKTKTINNNSSSKSTIGLHDKRTSFHEKLAKNDGNNKSNEESGNNYEFIPLEQSRQKPSSIGEENSLYDYDYDKDSVVHYRDQDSSESSDEIRLNPQNEPDLSDNEEPSQKENDENQKNNEETNQKKEYSYYYEPYKLKGYKTEFGKFANGVINEFLKKNLTSNMGEDDNENSHGFIINTENHSSDDETEKELNIENIEVEEKLEKKKESSTEESAEKENTAEENSSQEQPEEPFIIYTTTEETDDGNKTQSIEQEDEENKEKFQINLERNDTAEVKPENIDNHETFSTEYPFIINLDTFVQSKDEQQEIEKNSTQDITTTERQNIPKSINDIIEPKKVENQEKKFPNSIYDQIKLLENEEEVEEVEEGVTTTEATIDNSKNEQINNRLERMFKISPERMPKVSDVILHPSSREEDPVEEEFEQLDDSPNRSSILSVEGEESPEAEALRRKRKRKKRPFYRPKLHASVFDISSFIPKATTITPLLGLPSYIQTSIVPKYKPLSEVHYKDEIKPSEQLNVFADVINIIKNSSRDLQSESSSEIVQYSEPISVQINTNTKKVNTRRIKIPINRNKNKIRTNISHTFIPNTDVTSFQEQERHYPTTSTTTTTTEEPVEYINIRGKIKTRRPNISNEQLYREFLNKLREHQNDQNHHQKLANIFRQNQQETEQIFHRTHQNLLKPSRKKRPEFEQNIGEAADVADEVRVVKPANTRPQLLHPYKRIVEPQDDKQTQTVPYEEDESQPPNEEVVGLIPPKTRYTDYDSIYLTKKRLENSNPNHKSPHQRMNLYPVQGMLPPSQDTPILYSDFQILPIKSNSLIKRNTHRISKRSPAKPLYSEIRRNPSRDAPQENQQTEEDDDDYVPHRPQNFHYDEAKGKIVYDRKPAYEKEEPEYIEVEVYDDEPIPKDINAKKPKTTTTPAPPLIDFSIDRRNEFNYLDFVKKLKSDPTYQEIEDPKPTEKSASTTTTAKPIVPSGPQKVPEFLSILSKVKQDSSYESIEDKKEDKDTKKKTTTPPTIDSEIESEEEEEPLGDVQNSRGGQVFSEQSYQSSESHEDLPKVKNYSPRTTIDTSKYKSIERPSVNLSRSRSGEEEIDDSSISTAESDSLENAQKSYLISKGESEEDIRRNEFINRHNNKPNESTSPEDDEDAFEEDRRRNEFLARQEQRKRLQDQNVQEDSEEETRRKNSLSRHPNTNNQQQEPKPNSIPKRRRPTTVRPETSTEEKQEVTTKRNIRLRQRQRPTTLRPRTTTSSEKFSEESSPPSRPPHPTAKRIYPRRQKVRIRTTKDPEFDDEEGTTPLPRKLIRRHQSIKDSASLQRIPTNHKEFYTPLVVRDRLEADIGETMHVPARVITPDIIASAHDQAKIATKAEDAPAKIKDDVEVFSKYDTRAKHGGNYRRQNEKRNMRRYTTPRNEVESVSESQSGDDEEERLTDVVPKPESFYLDPKLPSNVNTLKDEVEEESKITESKNKEESDEKDDKDYDINDEIKIMVENKHPTTKKPIIIKDPSKRLYFYAPL